MAEMIASEEVYFPEIADVTFAVKIVNHRANLASIPTKFHTNKTAYFKAGNQDREPLSACTYDR